jgi:hypothetical protein
MLQAFKPIDWDDNSRMMELKHTLRHGVTINCPDAA